MKCLECSNRGAPGRLGSEAGRIPPARRRALRRQRRRSEEKDKELRSRPESHSSMARIRKEVQS